MNKLVGMWLCGLMVAACAVDDSGNLDSETNTDNNTDNHTGTAVSESQSYSPMGFARVTPTGGAAAGGFNSSGGANVVTYFGGGAYYVTFNGLGGSTSIDGQGGHVQLTAETTTNRKCRIINWGGAPNVVVYVQCTDVAGTGVDTGFAVQFYRYTHPTPNTQPTSIAYSWVTGSTSGLQPPAYDFNSSGNHNTVSWSPSTPGVYTVNIPGASVVNASIMVTTYGNAGGVVCSVSGWFSGGVSVQCRNAAGTLVNNPFTLSYAWSGPTLGQQGGHAWFDGSAANSFYSAGLGKIQGCSPATVTGTGGGTGLITMKVSGDLGSWSGGPFNRASFSTFYGGSGGYCNIQAEFATGVAPSSVGTTILQCYTPAGAVIASPQLTFTHVTDDVAGPC